jgi:hypothetical protein
MMVLLAKASGCASLILAKLADALGGVKQARVALAVLAKLLRWTSTTCLRELNIFR